MGLQSVSPQHEAMYYNRLEAGAVRCVLCPHDCKLSIGKTGICRGKKNVDGTLIAVNYGLTTAAHIDPIEKKPLYHYRPGEPVFSLGPNSCNLGCKFCQNWTISQVDAPTNIITPADCARLASAEGSIGVAYTYTEPLMWYEFLRDTAPLVKDRGLANILVTNGFINPEPLREILPYIDAMNIDLKSIDPGFYRKICKAKLEPVQKTIETAAKAEPPCHIELTNLVIPGYNDSPEQFHKLADWVASVSPSIPLHFSRYHPCYEFTAPATPVKTLELAYAIAKEKLDYVYIGNVLDPKHSNTYCPGCGATLIEREGFFSKIRALTESAHCAKCGRKIPVII